MSATRKMIVLVVMGAGACLLSFLLSQYFARQTQDDQLLLTQVQLLAPRVKYIHLLSRNFVLNGDEAGWQEITGYLDALVVEIATASHASRQWHSEIQGLEADLDAYVRLLNRIHDPALALNTEKITLQGLGLSFSKEVEAQIIAPYRRETGLRLYEGHQIDPFKNRIKDTAYEVMRLHLQQQLILLELLADWDLGAYQRKKETLARTMAQHKTQLNYMSVLVGGDTRFDGVIVSLDEKIERLALHEKTIVGHFNALADLNGELIDAGDRLLEASQRLTRQIMAAISSSNRLNRGLSWGLLVFILAGLGLVGALLARDILRFLKDIQASRESLRVSEERLDLALTGANEGIWDWNLADGHLVFDDRYYTLAGYAPHAFPAAYDEWTRRVHPDDVVKVKSAIDQYLGGEIGVYSIEFRFLRQDGGYMWIQGRGKIVARDEKGAPVRFIGTHADISERKQLEKSLRLARFIIDNANIGTFRIASDGRIREVNRKAAQLLGYTKEELASLSISDVDPQVALETWSLNWQRLRAKGNRMLEREHRRKDGSAVSVEIYSNLLAYEGQQYAIAFVQDITERKKTEKSLRLARFIIDNANIGIYRVAANAQIRAVNQKAAQLLGYTKTELESLALADIDPQVTPESWTRIWQDQVDHGVRIFERTHRRKDGSLMPVEIAGNFLEYEGEQYSIAFVQDITERKQAEKALRENEQLLGNILESMNEGVLVLDSEFRYTIFNKAMEVITDTPRQAVFGKRPWEAFPFLKNSPVEANQRKAMNGEVTGSTEVCLSLPHNPNAWTRDSFSPLRGEDGRIIGVVGVVSDITRQKRDEAALRQLQNYLGNIIDSMPSILVAVDSGGIVTQWNQQAEQDTGLSADSARSRALTEVFPRLAGELRRIEAAIREQRVISSAKVCRKLPNETRYEDITIYPLVSNGVTGAVIRLDDATERVRLEEMMIQSEKMLSVGGLAAGMAHEINNPLAGILQNASVLENRLLGDLPANHTAAAAAGTKMSAIRHYLSLRKLPGMLDNIRESGTRAADIVKNMLSFARKSDRVLSSENLATLLDRTLELVRTDYDMKKRYDVKQIHIVREYDPLAPAVPCEASKLQQVFMNILKNGAEAMAEAGHAPGPPAFVLRVRDDGPWVRVEIEDNGPGMREATRRRIFEPFFTTKPVGQGTGLGLSVSYFIVTEDHGGEMGVQTAEGGGTCFVVRLPKAGRA